MNQIKAFFDSKAPHWDDICQHDPKRLEQILDYARMAPHQSVLDVACGTGVLELHLLKRKPCQIHAIDLSEQMIEQAKAKFTDTCIHFEVADFLSMQKGEYDLVIIHNAYPHFLNKKALVQTVFRMLKAGGRFVVAHSASKEEINICHHKLDFKLSEPLKPVSEEALLFINQFAIDTLIDNDQIYVLSGIKRED